MGPIGWLKLQERIAKLEAANAELRQALMTANAMYNETHAVVARVHVETCAVARALVASHVLQETEIISARQTVEAEIRDLIARQGTEEAARRETESLDAMKADAEERWKAEQAQAGT